MTARNYALILDKIAKAPLKPPSRKSTLLAVTGSTKHGSSTSYASVPVLGRVAGVSSDTVRASLADLRSMGLVESDIGARSASHTINESLIMSFGNGFAGEPLFTESAEPSKEGKPKAEPHKAKVTDEDIPSELFPSEKPAEAPAGPEKPQEIQPVEGPHRSEKQARYAAATRLYLRHCDHMDRVKKNKGRKLRRAMSDMTAKKVRAFENVLKVEEMTEELIADAIDGVFSSPYHLDNDHLGVQMICAERGGRIQKYAGYKNKTRQLGGYVSSTANLNAQWGRTTPTQN